MGSLAPGHIGTAAVTFVAVAVSAPLATLITIVPAAYARGGGPLVPLTFAGLGVILLLFAAGHAAMAHRAPYAGALGTFVTRGLGRPAGTATAWLAVVSYQAIQLGLYTLTGAAAAPLLRGWFDLTVPWWQVAAACWLLVALLGPVRIEITGGLLALLVLASIAVVAGYTAANLIEPGPAGRTASSIVPDATTVDLPTLGLLLAAGMMTFIGFETAGAYGEETMRPRQEAGRAAYAAVIVISLLLAVASWAMAVGAGPERIVALARGRGGELVFDLAGARLPPLAVTLGRVILVTALVASMLALHHATTRYLFTLGRERLLPAALGDTARRTMAPRTASLTQTTLAAASLGIAYLLVDDPSAAGRRLIVVGFLGVLALLVATSVSTLLHLNRVPNGENAWTRFAAPLLSTVFLGTLLYLAVSYLPVLLGVPPDSPLRWSLPAVPVGAALLGAAQALLVKATRPVIYAGIGQNGVPVVVTPAAPGQREPGAHRPERVNGHA